MMDATNEKMLQSWANYLMGGRQVQETSTEGVSEETADRINHIRDMVDEEDWVLIDPESSDSENISLPSLHGNDIDDVEESWFITPPPCFTSTGPSNMRISPFENLLIEHPSMSVYKHAPRRGCLREILSPSLGRAETPEPEEEEELEVQEVDNDVAIVRRVIRRYRREAQLQERQYSKFVHSKKIQIQKANKPLKKSYMERNNKAREVNCRNHRQRRGERSQGQNRSRANNNRKC